MYLLIYLNYLWCKLFNLTKKLSLCGVTGKKLQWLKSYLSHRKQNIVFNEASTSCQTIACRVPKDLLLESFLVFDYGNELYKASDCTNPVMFADDTNMFYSNKNIKTIFGTTNFKLIRISEWLKKMSLNIDKANFILFHPRRDNKILALKPVLLSLGGFEIKQVFSATFFWVQMEEDLTEVTKNLRKNYLN